jgi:hypothetical protein
MEKSEFSCNIYIRKVCGVQRRQSIHTYEDAIWGCKVVVRVSGGSGRENFAVGLFVDFFRGPKCGVFYPGYIELRF